MIGGLDTLRFVGTIAGGVAVGVAGWFVVDSIDKRGEAMDARACAVAATGSADPLDRCKQEVRARIEEARRAAACHAAIGDADPARALFAIRAACPASVKRLVVALDATAAERDGAIVQRDAALAGAGAAVERAESRSSRSQDKAKANARIIDAAPRVDGRIVCDADCLRGLTD